jgi:ribosomal protein S18 acetylase RimI-like enzyme
MTPMDKAWLVLKAPLIEDSIRRVNQNRFEANFLDPKTNTIYPMVAEKDPEFGLMNVGIYPNQPQTLGTPTGIDAMDMTDNDIDDDVKEMLGLGFSNAELGETDRHGYEHEGDKYWESYMTWTDPEKRRRGYASALYDFVNQISPRQVRPSSNQSDEGKLLWSKRKHPI